MKTIRFAVAAMVAVGFASMASAQQQQQQSTPPKPVNVAAGTQGGNSGFLTEVKPGVWVRGTPDKPIFAGSALIVPEAYDFVLAKDGGSR